MRLCIFGNTLNSFCALRTAKIYSTFRSSDCYPVQLLCSWFSPFEIGKRAATLPNPICENLRPWLCYVVQRLFSSLLHSEPVFDRERLHSGVPQYYLQEVLPHMAIICWKPGTTRKVLFVPNDGPQKWNDSMFHGARTCYPDEEGQGCITFFSLLVRKARTFLMLSMDFSHGDSSVFHKTLHEIAQLQIAQVVSNIQGILPSRM